MATSLVGPVEVVSISKTAPVPRPPQPTRATRMVLSSAAKTPAARAGAAKARGGRGGGGGRPGGAGGTWGGVGPAVAGSFLAGFLRRAEDVSGTTAGLSLRPRARQGPQDLLEAGVVADGVEVRVGFE